MALSGYFTGSTANQAIVPKIEWSGVQSIAGNYTDVTATLYYSRTDSYVTGGTWSGSITIGGTVTNGSKSEVRITLNSNTQVMSATVRIYHKDDGTQSVTISAKGSISGSTLTSTSISQSVTLDTIPRASGISATDANVESTSLIAIAKHSSGFTTTVSYKATGQSSYTTIWTKQAHTSYGWTVPTALYSLMPRAREIAVELRCQTYSGDTLIGTSYGSMTARTDPSKCQPASTITGKDSRAATVALTGDNRKIIKGISTLEATITTSARNSASLVNTTVTCGSKNTVSTSGQFTATFAKAESATVSLASKDTRDYVTYAKDDLTLINYVSPTVTTTITRPSPTAPLVNITVSGVCYAGGFGAATNSVTAKVRYKPKGQESYTNSYANMNVVMGGASYTATIQFAGLAYTSAYDLEVVVSDAIHNGTIEPVLTKTEEIRKGVPVFDWGESDFNVNGALMINGTLNVADEATKTNKCIVNKSWWGASGDVLNTGISVLGSSYGKTILMVLSSHSGSGTATTSEVGMIWCGFDSGTFVYTCIAATSGGNTVGSQFTFSVGSDKNIYIKGNRPVISMTAIIAD